MGLMKSFNTLVVKGVRALTAVYAAQKYRGTGRWLGIFQEIVLPGSKID